MRTLRRIATTPHPLQLWRWELRATAALAGGLVAMLLSH